MVEGFEEEAPPPPERSMHINGRGHRPLTSPFSRGRGAGLCEIGFNDPIVERVMHLHRVHTVCLTFCSTLHTRYPLLHWPIQPWVRGLDKKSVALYLTCCMQPAASSRSSSLPHLFEPPLPSLPIVLILPCSSADLICTFPPSSFILYILKKEKASAGQDSFSLWPFSAFFSVHVTWAKHQAGKHYITNILILDGWVVKDTHS